MVIEIRSVVVLRWAASWQRAKLTSKGYNFLRCLNVFFISIGMMVTHLSKLIQLYI